MNIGVETLERSCIIKPWNAAQCRFNLFLQFLCINTHSSHVTLLVTKTALQLKANETLKARTFLMYWFHRRSHPS
jgi:hypothetical protein